MIYIVGEGSEREKGVDGEDTDAHTWREIQKNRQTRRDQIRQDKTRRDKTRQDKTRQDKKTRHDTKGYGQRDTK